MKLTEIKRRDEQLTQALLDKDSPGMTFRRDMGIVGNMVQSGVITYADAQEAIADSTLALLEGTIEVDKWLLDGYLHRYITAVLTQLGLVSHAPAEDAVTEPIPDVTSSK